VALNHPIAGHGFDLDYGAMQRADTGVLLLPSGRSAHLEAGYFVGAGKPLHILIPELPEPELMYLMADGIYTDLGALLRALEAQP
jgi:nucleoside 2-deoxyribosyltransferase